MIVGSGSGSVPRTNGSRSLRPENMLIRIRNIEQPSIKKLSTNTTCCAGAEPVRGPAAGAEAVVLQ
jgi:hypothetical protein